MRHDPDQRGCGRTSSAWIHSGGGLLQVSMGQLRPARGHEHFLPSADDWAILEKLKAHPEEELADAVDAREPPEHEPVMDVRGLLSIPSANEAVGEAELGPLEPMESSIPRTPSQRIPGTPSGLPSFAIPPPSQVADADVDSAEPSAKRSRPNVPQSSSLILVS